MSDRRREREVLDEDQAEKLATGADGPPPPSSAEAARSDDESAKSAPAIEASRPGLGSNAKHVSIPGQRAFSPKARCEGCGQQLRYAPGSNSLKKPGRWRGGIVVMRWRQFGLVGAIHADDICHELQAQLGPASREQAASA